MQLNILKYILDIESVISEIESMKLKANNDFSAFKSDMILRRAAERDLEIIGEAVRKILEIEPTIEITSVKNIIILRNLKYRHHYKLLIADFAFKNLFSRYF